MLKDVPIPCIEYVDEFVGLNPAHVFIHNITDIDLPPRPREHPALALRRRRAHVEGLQQLVDNMLNYEANDATLCKLGGAELQLGLTTGPVL
ncbi:hypothetical protein DFH07DRAFT_971977 [Mycena maculata]|uniref:Uncharacterized protein n=1 Tax=Mycena maculata TaxID=230809 RepID=A0AAD7HJP4_9AGAR|nr:hypothetical protein DFH07DRAFT_971977 [Mycena maculata]